MPFLRMRPSILPLLLRAAVLARSPPYPSPSFLLPRRRFASTSPLSPPSALYDAVVHSSARSQANSSPPMPAPTTDESAYHTILARLSAAHDAPACLSVLDEMSTRGLDPRPDHLVLALRACVRSGDSETASTLSDRLAACPDGPEKALALQRTRSVPGLCQASARKPQGVLDVMGWEETDNVAELVARMGIGRDSTGWGLVAWALNKVGKPEETLRLMEAVPAVTGLLVTDSMYHLTIQAQGMLGLSEDAYHTLSIMLSRGLEPSERTVGSLLSIFVSGHLHDIKRQRRRAVDPERIREICSIIADPSERFLVTKLNAYATFGLLDDCEASFEALAVLHDGDPPDERACMTLMRLYAALLSRSAPAYLDESETSDWFARLHRKTDRLWKVYFDAYGHLPPSHLEAHARMTIFPRYIQAKALAGDGDGALKLVVDAASEKAVDDRPWFEPDSLHYNSLLFGLERSFNIDALYCALRAMSDAKVEMTDSSLASAILILVSDGDPVRAAKLLCVHADTLLAVGNVEHPARRSRLVRRVSLLLDSLKEAFRSRNFGAKGTEGLDVGQMIELESKVRRIAANLN